jgi:hypothetical protein
VALYGLSDEQAAAARADIAEAALDAARLAAARHLLAGLAAGAGDAHTVTEVLTTRDPTDSRYELLSAIAKPWALLSLQLVAGILSDPSTAVADARDCGASVTEIASTLGVTEPAIYKRYAAQLRRPRG